MQETQPRASSTVILAAYVSPDAVGHSLLVVRDRGGKTLWKRNLGWKYHLEAGGGNTVTVRTLLPDGQTWARTFNAQTGGAPGRPAVCGPDRLFAAGDARSGQTLRGKARRTVHPPTVSRFLFVEAFADAPAPTTSRSLAAGTMPGTRRRYSPV